MDCLSERDQAIYDYLVAEKTASLAEEFKNLALKKREDRETRGFWNLIDIAFSAGKRFERIKLGFSE